MKPSLFDVLLAKNNIAREIRDYMASPAGEREPIHISYIIHELKTIEMFIADCFDKSKTQRDNQPSVVDILNSEYRL